MAAALRTGGGDSDEVSLGFILEGASMTIPSRYGFIDVTRALAALVVVVSHSQQLIIDRPLSPGIVHQALSMMTSQGHNAVVVFFVISGFWIVRSVCRAGDGFSIKDYLLARGVRLWIVLLPALLIGASIDSVGCAFFPSALYEGAQGSVALTYSVADRLNVPTFLGNVLFLQDIAVHALGSNGALWTVACEFWYYIYFPLVWMAVRSKNPVGISVAALALLLLPSLHLFACWMLGGGVYVVAERMLQNRQFHWTLPASALAVFCLINAVSKLLDWPSVTNDLALALSFAGFLVLGMRSSFGAATYLSWLATLGSRSSYSLYAIHLPIVVFLANFFVPAARMPASIYAWGLVFAISSVCVVLAIAFSRFTEDQTATVKRLVAGGGNKSGAAA